MGDCRVCTARFLEVKRAQAELKRVAKMCARRTDARNLALVHEAKARVAFAKQEQGAHERECIPDPEDFCPDRFAGTESGEHLVACGDI